MAGLAATQPFPDRVHCGDEVEREVRLVPGLPVTDAGQERPGLQGIGEVSVVAKRGRRGKARELRRVRAPGTRRGISRWGRSLRPGRGARHVEQHLQTLAGEGADRGVDRAPVVAGARRIGRHEPRRADGRGDLGPHDVDPDDRCAFGHRARNPQAGRRGCVPGQGGIGAETHGQALRRRLGGTARDAQHDGGEREQPKGLHGGGQLVRRRRRSASTAAPSTLAISNEGSSGPSPPPPVAPVSDFSTLLAGEDPSPFEALARASLRVSRRRRARWRCGLRQRRGGGTGRSMLRKRVRGGGGDRATSGELAAAGPVPPALPVPPARWSARPADRSRHRMHGVGRLSAAGGGNRLEVLAHAGVSGRGDRVNASLSRGWGTEGKDQRDSETPHNRGYVRRPRRLTARRPRLRPSDLAVLAGRLTRRAALVRGLARMPAAALFFFL